MLQKLLSSSLLSKNGRYKIIIISNRKWENVSTWASILAFVSVNNCSRTNINCAKACFVCDVCCCSCSLSIWISRAFSSEDCKGTKKKKKLFFTQFVHPINRFSPLFLVMMVSMVQWNCSKATINLPAGLMSVIFVEYLGKLASILIL